MVTFYYDDNKMSLVILCYYNNHSSFLISYLFLLMVYVFCSISFKLSLSLYLKYVSCHQHIVCSDNLWLLITMFRPSTFNVSIEIVGSLSSILLLFSCFVPLILLSLGKSDFFLFYFNLSMVFSAIFLVFIVVVLWIKIYIPNFSHLT